MNAPSRIKLDIPALIAELTPAAVGKIMRAAGYLPTDNPFTGPDMSLRAAAWMEGFSR